MRPLAIDVGTFLLPLGVAALLFWIGTRFRRWPAAVRGATVVVCLAGIAAASLSAATRLPETAESIVYQLGGMTTLLCWTAVYLLGAVWGVPGRSLSSSFLVALAGIALVVVAVEAGGRLWWRFAPDDVWNRTVNDDGFLRQSSGMTCSPAAAVMLLNRFGVKAGEGEMAYLAGTSLFGTDTRSIARALRAKGAPLGWGVDYGRLTYEECLRQGGPFLAHVKGATGGHAVCVVEVTPYEVLYLDPALGELRYSTRREFEENWDGTVVRIVK